MITLINPNLVVQLNDPFTTGIVYMPIGLAYFVGSLRKHGFECTVHDTFGESPNSCRIENNLMFRGLDPLKMTERIDVRSQAIVIYASHVMCHRSIIQIVRAVRDKFAHMTIILLENAHAVTAYSLRHLQEEYYNLDVNYIVTGDMEERGIELIKALQSGKGRKEIEMIDGIGFRDNGRTYYSLPVRIINDLDSLPFPAWEFFPLENYWKLKYAHGPLETSRYLPILTSRGCPYSCKFCVIPETNAMKWRARSAKNIVDEIEYFYQECGVREFHIEDVNPTVSDDRTRSVCDEVIKRNLKIIWKIAAGTKAETIRNEETIELMAKAGCRYISISPESGSERVLKMTQKPFDLHHATRLIKNVAFQRKVDR